MKLTNGEQAAVKIGLFGGIGLMQHALIAITRGARLIGIHAHHKHQLILHTLLQAGKACGILEHGRLAINGARTDKQDLFIAFPFKYFSKLGVVRGFCCRGAQCDGIFLLYLLGGRKLVHEFH